MRESKPRLLVVAGAVRVVAGAALVVAGVLWVGACAPPAQRRYEEKLERASEPAAHAVQAQRLDQLMRGLSRLRDDRLPRNMDVRGEEERRAERIAKIALAMAQAADRIPGAASDAELDPAQQAEFARHADALRREAQKLADVAPELSSAEIRAQAEAIDATCDQCHQQFRIPRGRRDAE